MKSRFKSVEEAVNWPAQRKRNFCAFVILAILFLALFCSVFFYLGLKAIEKESCRPATYCDWQGCRQVCHNLMKGGNSSIVATDVIQYTIPDDL